MAANQRLILGVGVIIALLVAGCAGGSEPAQEPAVVEKVVTQVVEVEKVVEVVKEVEKVVEVTAAPAAEEPAAALPMQAALTCDRAAWTVMVYLAADNDLGDAGMARQVLDAIRWGTDNDDVRRSLNVAVLYDPPGLANSEIWAKSCRDEQPLRQRGDAMEQMEGGEVNAGDWQTLASFVRWAKSEYPADHTFLTLIGHGYGIAPENPISTAGAAAPASNSATGWTQGGTGLALDTIAGGGVDFLSTRELAWGLQNTPVDILFLHANAMATFETAFEVRDFVDFVIAGQNYLYGPGRYDLYLKQMAWDALQEQPPERVATNWAEQVFVNTAPVAPAEHPLQIGVVRGAALNPAAATWFNLTDALLASRSALGNSEWLRRLEQASDAAQRFDYDADLKIDAWDGYVDAAQLALALQKSFADARGVPEAAAAAARELQAATVDQWVASGAVSDPAGAQPWDLGKSTGLSIFFPLRDRLQAGAGCSQGNSATCYDLQQSYTDSNFLFAAAGQWDELVRSLNPSSVKSVSSQRPALLPKPEDIPPYVVSSTGGSTMPTVTLVGWESSPPEQGLLASCNVQYLAWPDYANRLRSALLAGDQSVDLFLVDATLIPSLVRSNLAVPLDSYLAQAMIDRTAFVQRVVDAFTLEGLTFAIPRDFSTLALFYNKGLFNRAGIPTPDSGWTWTELQQTSKMLSESVFVAGLALSANTDRMPAFIIQNGGRVLSQDWTEVLLDSPSAVDAARFYAGLRSQGWAVLPEDTGARSPGELFGRGDAAMVIETYALTSYVAQRFPQVSYGAVAPPAGPAGEGNLLFATGYALSPSSRYPMAAVKALACLTSEASQTWLMQSGQVLPARRSMQQQLGILSDPAAAEAAQVMSTAVDAATPFGWGPHHAEIDDSLHDALRRSLHQNMDIESSFRQAAQEMRTAIGR